MPEHVRQLKIIPKPTAVKKLWWRCWGLFFHNYSKWEWENMLQLGQRRICMDCGKAQRAYRMAW